MRDFMSFQRIPFNHSDGMLSIAFLLCGIPSPSSKRKKKKKKMKKEANTLNSNMSFRQVPELAELNSNGRF